MDLVINDRSSVPLPAAFAGGIAFVAASAVTAIAVAVGATHHQAEVLLPLGLLTAGISLWTTWAGAVAAAWICWSLDSGFVLGREARLTFSATSQQVVLLLVGLAVLGGCVGRAVRRRRVRPAGIRTRSSSAPDS